MNIIIYNLSGKVVLITGAVGQLGSSIAKIFANNNASVIVSDLDIEKCNELESCLANNENSSHTSLNLDVTSEISVNKAKELIEKKYSKLDILINNAATAIFSDSSLRKKDEFMKVFEVNTYGTFNCIQKLLPLMSNKQQSTSIINIASVYGCVSSDPRIYGDLDRKNSEIYSVSKAGVIQMTKYLSIHYADKNIRINSISPGGIFNNHDKNFSKNYSNRVPLKRMADVEEILGSILFLSDDKLSSYITGQNIIIDGGMTSW